MTQPPWHTIAEESAMCIHVIKNIFCGVVIICFFAPNAICESKSVKDDILKYVSTVYRTESEANQAAQRLVTQMYRARSKDLQYFNETIENLRDFHLYIRDQSSMTNFLVLLNELRNRMYRFVRDKGAKRQNLVGFVSLLAAEALIVDGFGYNMSDRSILVNVTVATVMLWMNFLIVKARSGAWLSIDNDHLKLLESIDQINSEKFSFKETRNF